MRKLITFLVVFVLLALSMVFAWPHKTSVAQVTIPQGDSFMTAKPIVCDPPEEPLVQGDMLIVAPVRTFTISELKYYARCKVIEQWGDHEWEAFNTVVHKESSWNPNAINPSSGACGLPQALPCSKLGTKDPIRQLDWMVDYINRRYGTPTKSLEFHLINNWY